MRIEPGNQVEEAHMRNRQLIARWVFEKGAADKVVEMVKRDGKTYVVVNDYAKVRELFGQLLAEIQRIKSTGDFAAARDLVEQYAVKVDPVLHKEVLERLFGQLLAEIQRIKSTGDFAAARDLVEQYAVKVDPVLHKEVLERYKKLNLAPYKGFVNPKYEAVTDASGEITDVKVTYDEGYAEQMLRYSKDYSVLPDIN